VLKPVPERKALVLFTDGKDTQSLDSNKSETMDLSKETESTIYCVYYDTRRGPDQSISIIKGFPPLIINPGTRTIGGQTGPIPNEPMFGYAYLKELAENSGGLVLDGNEDLRGTFAEIARELASQYSIGYYPTGSKRDGKFRKLKVKTKDPDLRVRTRKGYYARRH